MIEYSARLRIGFIVDTGSVLAPFRVELPELSHVEPRFDPRTGKRAADLKVVDQEAGTVIQVGDEVFDDDPDITESRELLSDIVRLLGIKCDVDLLDEGSCIFYLNPQDVSPDVDVMGLTCGGSASFRAVVVLEPRLATLKSKLKKAGIRADEARVVVVGHMED